MAEKIPGKPIQAGYEWTLRIKTPADGLTFPIGATYIAQVRRAPAAPDVLATMTTANEGIKRFDDHNLDLILTGAQSDGWPENRKVFIDIVQTDVAPPKHLGFRLIVPVQQPITRDLA